MDRWVYGWMSGWVGGWMGGLTDGDGWMDRRMDGWKDGWIGWWMDRWMHGKWMDGWVDGRRDNLTTTVYLAVSVDQSGFVQSANKATMIILDHFFGTIGGGGGVIWYPGTLVVRTWYDIGEKERTYNSIHEVSTLCFNINTTPKPRAAHQSGRARWTQ